MFTRGRGAIPSGRRLHPSTPAPVLRKAGVMRGQVNFAKTHQFNPPEVQLRRLGWTQQAAHRQAVKLKRADQATPFIVGHNPIGNIVRTLAFGLPGEIHRQIVAPPERIAQALSRGKLPSREDIGSTLSMLPFGPRGDFALRPNLGPEALAHERVQGWTVRTPQPGEKRFTWQGQLRTVPEPPGRGGFDPEVTRNVYHHGTLAGTLHGFLKTASREWAWQPEDVRQLNVGEMYVRNALPHVAAKVLARRSARVAPRVQRSGNAADTVRYPGAGQHLFQDALGVLAKHGLELKNVSANFANTDLRHAIEAFASRHYGRKMKMDSLLGLVPMEQWLQNLEDSLHGTGVHARPNPTPLDAPIAHPNEPFGDMLAASESPGPHEYVSPLTPLESQLPPVPSHNQVGAPQLSRLTAAEREALATKLFRMGEESLPSLVRGYGHADPQSQARTDRWVYEALTGEGLSAHPSFNIHSPAHAARMQELARIYRQLHQRGQRHR